MHYRALEKDKTIVLKKFSQFFDKQISQISSKASVELHWWLKEIQKALRSIHLPKLDFVISFDASQTGWGAIDGNNSGGKWLKNQEYTSII